MTKIDDPRGSRNEQALMRRGKLFFTPDGNMYVYYMPTHWRELTDEERTKERALLATRLQSAYDEIKKAMDRL